MEFIDDGEEPRFRNYGPTPEDPQTEGVMAQLGAALNVRADIILFPEYAVPARAWAEVEHRLADQSTAALRDPHVHVPTLVVGGTGLGRGGPVNAWRNEARLVTPRGTAHVTKCHAATIEGHREDLGQPAGEVRIFMTPRYAISVLICRDGLEPDILRQLEDCGVNLCLAPAMTPKTGSLVPRVCSLATASQTVVVFVNTPGAWDRGTVDANARALAAFHGPYESHPHFIELPDPDERPLRQPAVWDLRRPRPGRRPRMSERTQGVNNS